MSVSTLMIFKGAATPSRVVNFSIDALPVNEGQGRLFIANGTIVKGPILQS
jgi:hypothetical protein